MTTPAGTSALEATQQQVLAQLQSGLSGSSITANAGTNLNTSALALESGGHLATIDTSTSTTSTNTSNISTASGTTADSAYAGSGSTTIIAALKGLYSKLAGTLAQNITQVAGNAIATGNNAVPILNSAATGYVTAYGSNPASLTANTDASFKWGASGTTQVNHVMLQNNGTINVLFDLDVATNAGSPICAPGQTMFFDVQTTALHLQANGTPNINGSTASNIVVRAWL